MMKKFYKTTIIGLTVLIIAGATLLTLIGCKKASQKEPEVIKIGAILPLTGDLGVYGQNDKMGIDLAVEKANIEGGINGKKIEMIYEDNHGEAKQAISALQKLKEQGIFIIIDDAVSTITLSMVPVATTNKMVIISTGATNPQLSGSSPYFFRIWNSDAEEGIFAAKFIIQELGVSKTLIIYVNNDYGKGLAEVFKKQFEKLGGKITGEIAFDIKAKNFRDIITKAKNIPSEIIYLVGYASETGIIVKQMREQEIKTRIVGTVATEDAKFIELAGESANGIIYPFSKSPDGSVSEKFKQEFMKKYHKEPQILCDVGYDAANLAIYTLKSGAQNGDDVRKSLSQIKNFQGASGTIEFDKYGDVHKPMIMKIIKDKKFQILTEKDIRK